MLLDENILQLPFNYFAILCIFCESFGMGNIWVIRRNFLTPILFLTYLLNLSFNVNLLFKHKTSIVWIFSFFLCRQSILDENFEILRSHWLCKAVTLEHLFWLFQFEMKILLLFTNQFYKIYSGGYGNSCAK